MPSQLLRFLASTRSDVRSVQEIQAGFRQAAAEAAAAAAVEAAAEAAAAAEDADAPRSMEQPREEAEPTADSDGGEEASFKDRVRQVIAGHFPGLECRKQKVAGGILVASSGSTQYDVSKITSASTDKQAYDEDWAKTYAEPALFEARSHAALLSRGASDDERSTYELNANSWCRTLVEEAGEQTILDKLAIKLTGLAYEHTDPVYKTMMMDTYKAMVVSALVTLQYAAAASLASFGDGDSVTASELVFSHLKNLVTEKKWIELEDTEPFCAVLLDRAPSGRVDCSELPTDNLLKMRRIVDAWADDAAKGGQAAELVRECAAPISLLARRAGGACAWCCSLASECDAINVKRAASTGKASDWIWTPYAPPPATGPGAEAGALIAFARKHYGLSVDTPSPEGELPLRRLIRLAERDATVHLTAHLSARLPVLARTGVTVDVRQILDGAAVFASWRGEAGPSDLSLDVFMRAYNAPSGEFAEVTWYNEKETSLKLASTFFGAPLFASLITHDLSTEFRVKVTAGFEEERAVGRSAGVRLLHKKVSDSVHVLASVGGGSCSVPNPWGKVDFAGLNAEANKAALHELDAVFAPVPKELKRGDPLRLRERAVGNLWHIFPADDEPMLANWITREMAGGRVVASRWSGQENSVLNGNVYLLAADLDRLRTDTGIQPWVVYQQEEDALLLPAGCPRQMRSLASTTSLEVDFMAPSTLLRSRLRSS